MLLIEDYEEKSFGLPRASAAGALQFLMEQRNMLPEDLAEVFGGEETVSEVLKENRDLSTEEIRRLSHIFHVSPAVFF